MKHNEKRSLQLQSENKCEKVELFAIILFNFNNSLMMQSKHTNYPNSKENH